MRVFAFVSAIIACLLYGLVFDAVAGGIFDGLICYLAGTESCALPASVDHWLSFISILFVIPASCYLLLNWFVKTPGVMRSTTLFGLLMVAS